MNLRQPRTTRAASGHHRDSDEPTNWRTSMLMTWRTNTDTHQAKRQQHTLERSRSSGMDRQTTKLVPALRLIGRQRQHIRTLTRVGSHRVDLGPSDP